MKVAITLQNHGCKNHPLWWIFIMGAKKNKKGRFIEHVGYWNPRATRTVQRSVTLNKPRLRYWLAMGAQPTTTVQKFLSFVDMMPKPLAKHGSKTIYEKAVSENHIEQKHLKPHYMKGSQKTYSDMRMNEERNSFVQKMLIADQLNQEIDFQTMDYDKNLRSMGEINDRTKTFYELQEKYQEYEKDKSKLNSFERDNLFREMNKIAQQGIRDQNDIKLKQQDQQNYEFDEKLFQQAESIKKETLLKKLQYQKIIQEIRQSQENMIKDQELIKPISKEDFTQQVKLKLNIDRYEITKQVNEFYKEYKEQDQVPLDIDLKHFIENNNNQEDAKSLVKIIKDKKFKGYAPNTRPIIPFPNIIAYDPKDYHDLDEIDRVTTLTKSNRGYDLPNINDLKIKKNMNKDKVHSTRQASGRKKGAHHFRGFSTLNNQLYCPNFIKQNSNLWLQQQIEIFQNKFLK